MITYSKRSRFIDKNRVLPVRMPSIEQRSHNIPPQSPVQIKYFLPVVLLLLGTVLLLPVLNLRSSVISPTPPDFISPAPPDLKEDFLELWLHVRNTAADCMFEPSVVTEDEWFHTIKPDLTPNFTLTSAWLKSEAPSGMDAPKEIPQMYESDFSMGGKIENIGHFYFNQAYLGKTAETYIWDIPLINKMMEKASKREFMKYRKDGLKIHDGAVKYKSYIKGKRGIVIGSEDPWVEAILLHHGAGKLLTVEFGKITCEHPQIDTMVPKAFTDSFLNGRIKQFDFGMTFSSLEHDGLGRYGDVINPIGDLQSMAKMLSVVKPGGLMFIAVPLWNGTDALEWNAHRVYGKYRLPKLFAGWNVIDIIGRGRRKDIQHLWVLQNTNGCKDNLP